MSREEKLFLHKLISSRDVPQKIEQTPPPCKGDGMRLHLDYTWVAQKA